MSSSVETMPILFMWHDYSLAATIMGLSTIIGVYFGFLKKKQNTTEEYLLGGKTMCILPVAISFIASQVSGTTLLAVPADVYKFGSNYLWIGLSIMLICLITNYVFLPVFFNLQVATVYEYLSLRFDKKMRALGACLFIVTLFICTPVTLYTPSLAFAQVTGIPLAYIAPVICIVCTFYTTIGGFKAVIWTDTIQFGGVIISVIAIAVAGVMSVGGLGIVWGKANTNQRLDLFNLDPTLRDGFWIMTIGGTFHMMSLITINQSSLQKYLAVPTLRDARKTIIIFGIGLVIMKFLCVLIGNIVYATFSNCDPVLAKQIQQLDQILPYFVMNLSTNFPGLPGIFVAGIFSATLSSLSVYLNTLAGTIFEEFVAPYISPEMSQARKTSILKWLVVIISITCLLLATILEKVEGILPFLTALQSVCGGPLLGLFVLGILFPMANATGAMFGSVSSLILTSLIVFGQQWYQSLGLLNDFSKGITTEGCNFIVNITLPDTTDLKEPAVFYELSFWYNTLIGTLIVIIIGLLVSRFTKETNYEVNTSLISPVLRFFYPEKSEIKKSFHEYSTIGNTLFKYENEKSDS